ncbi:MAG: hypothetical protein HRU09_01055 [Oligoflexales bacterium]|nr:hypothetical protein [Oligoflexales bacterium]
METNKQHKQKFLWTKEAVSIEALKYSTIGEFKNKASGAYKYASRLNILDSVCSHMVRPKQRIWTDEKLKETAEKYSNLKEFKTHESNAYATAISRRILEYVCSHMPEYSHVEGKHQPIKKLSKPDKAALRETQEARAAAGLNSIEVKIRKCIICKALFESIGDRTCGCLKDRVTTLFGIDVV